MKYIASVNSQSCGDHKSKSAPSGTSLQLAWFWITSRYRHGALLTRHSVSPTESLTNSNIKTLSDPRIRYTRKNSWHTTSAGKKQWHKSQQWSTSQQTGTVSWTAAFLNSSDNLMSLYREQHNHSERITTGITQCRYNTLKADRRFQVKQLF